VGFQCITLKVSLNKYFKQFFKDNNGGSLFCAEANLKKKKDELVFCNDEKYIKEQLDVLYKKVDNHKLMFF